MLENICFCLKQISMCDTCYYTLFFMGNIVFRSVALVKKKLWAIFFKSLKLLFIN